MLNIKSAGRAAGVGDAVHRHGHVSLSSTSPPTVPVIATLASDTFRRIDDVVGRDGVEDDARHRRQRVDRLHRQGRGVRGAGRVGGNASRHAHGQNALEACHRRHHQRVGVAIDRRERTLGSVDDRDVSCVKAGHRLAELESIENAAAGDGSRTSLVVGDRDGQGRCRVQRHANTATGRVTIGIHDLHRNIENHWFGEDRGGAKTRDDKWVTRYVGDLEAVESGGRIGGDCCTVYQPVDDHRPISLAGNRKGVTADHDGINKG